MKKVLKVLTVIMILCVGSMFTLSTSNAQSPTSTAAELSLAKKGHWVTINTHYEDGEWHILQECKTGGSTCVRGTFQTKKLAGAVVL